MIKLTRTHHTHTGHERTLKLYYAHAHKEVKNAKNKKRKKLIHIISNAARTHTYTHTCIKTIYNEEINVLRNLEINYLGKRRVEVKRKPKADRIQKNADKL